MSSTGSITESAAEREHRILVRSEDIFTRTYDEVARRTDRLFGWLMVAQWAFAIVIALTVSPRTWTGPTSTIHLHVYTAVGLGGLISSLPWVMMRFRLGR